MVDYENRQEKIRDFINFFIPEKNNFGEKRDLRGFSIFWAGNFAHGEFPEIDFHNQSGSFEKIQNEKVRLSFDAADNYFTPNLFAAPKKKTEDNLAWITSLWVDIDGIEGCYSQEEGEKRLLKACEKAGVEYPNIVVLTSFNPEIRLQCFWLIDPIYVYGESGVEYKNWWVRTSESLVQALKRVDPGFKIDAKVSKNPTNYMRLPYTIHQKTKELTKVIAKEIDGKRFTLKDAWLKNLRENNSCKGEIVGLNFQEAQKNLLEHEQIKKVRNGVPRGFRNKAQYALAKACLASGLDWKEATDEVLAQNKKCSPPEKVSKVENLVRRAYGIIGPEKKALYNFRPDVLAEFLNEAFGTSFRPDWDIFYQFRAVATTQKKRVRERYLTSKETAKRIVMVILKYWKGKKPFLPRQDEIAEEAGVKYNSLIKIWRKKILPFLRVLNINVKKEGRTNRFIMETLNEPGGNKKVLCKTIYSIRGCFNGITYWSQFLEQKLLIKQSKLGPVDPVGCSLKTLANGSESSPQVHRPMIKVWRL